MREETGGGAGAVIGAFGRVASAVVAGRPRDEILTVIAASVRELVVADLAAVTIRFSERDVVTIAADGVDAADYRGMHYPSEGTSTDRVLRTGETVVIDDLAALSYIRERSPWMQLGPTAFVPIVLDGPYGVLSVSRLSGGEQFSSEDVELIRTFADQAALVLASDSDRRRAAEVERINEQTRLAVQLQDSAVNELFNATMSLSSLAGELHGEHERLRVVLAIDALDHAIKLIREAAFGALQETSQDTPGPRGLSV